MGNFNIANSAAYVWLYTTMVCMGHHNIMYGSQEVHLFFDLTRTTLR